MRISTPAPRKLSVHAKHITLSRWKDRQPADGGDDDQHMTKQQALLRSMAAISDNGGDVDVDDPPLTVPSFSDSEDFFDTSNSLGEDVILEKQDVDLFDILPTDDSVSPYCFAGGRVFRPAVIFAETPNELLDEIQSYETISSRHIPSLTELSLRATMEHSRSSENFKAGASTCDNLDSIAWRVENANIIKQLPPGMIEATENTSKDDKTTVDLTFTPTRELLSKLVRSKLGRHMSRLKVYSLDDEEKSNTESTSVGKSFLCPKLEVLKFYKQHEIRKVDLSWKSTPYLRELYIEQRPSPIPTITLERFRINLPALRMLRIECIDLTSRVSYLLLSLAKCPNLHDIALENITGIEYIDTLVIPSCEKLSLRFSDVKRAKLWAPKLKHLDIERTALEHMDIVEDAPTSIQVKNRSYDISNLASDYPSPFPCPKYSVNIKHVPQGAFIGGNVLENPRCGSF